MPSGFLVFTYVPSNPYNYIAISSEFITQLNNSVVLSDLAEYVILHFTLIFIFNYTYVIQ